MGFFKLADVSKESCNCVVRMDRDFNLTGRTKWQQGAFWVPTIRVIISYKHVSPIIRLLKLKNDKLKSNKTHKNNLNILLFRNMLRCLERQVRKNIGSYWREDALTNRCSQLIAELYRARGLPLVMCASRKRQSKKGPDRRYEI